VEETTSTPRTEDVVAVHLPVRIPCGFHDNWIPPSTNYLGAENY
jgi:carotenoid cleavage dioxygenase-like enzyme